MSGSQFRADPDSLRSQAAGLQQLSTEMKAIVSGLQAKLAGEGAAWGGDEPGSEFSSSYLPQKGTVDAALQAQLRFLDGNAEGLRTTADTAEHL